MCRSKAPLSEATDPAKKAGEGWEHRSGEASSPKHLIIFIHPCLIFQRVFFPHREIIHFLYIQYTFQIRMTDKIHSIEIICFSFHPVGRRK